MIHCKTDYPLCSEDTIIGPSPDISGKEAPLRDALVLGWDGDKYATVLVQFPNGDLGLYDFKIGYCYLSCLTKTKHGYQSIPRYGVPILSFDRRKVIREGFIKMIPIFNKIGEDERAKLPQKTTLPDIGSYDLYVERPTNIFELLLWARQ